MNTNDRKSQRNQSATNNSNRPLPQAVELEKTVLGALMIDTDAYSVVSQILTPDSFYEDRHQLIYVAIQMLSTEGYPVNELTVCEQLIKNGTSDKVGGPLYVCELAIKVASSANIEYYAKIVVQKYLARKMIIFARETEAKAFNETLDIDDVMIDTANALMQIKQQCSQRNYPQVYDVVKEANEEMTADASCPDGITGVPSFGCLDTITGGFQNKDLIIIAARPSMGKTAFALSCAKKISIDRHIPAAFFTLEMSNVQLVKRLISNVCEIGGTIVNRGLLSQADWDRFDKNIYCFKDAPLYMAETPGLNVGDFRLEAKKLVKEKGVKIIFIDYLQLMNYKGKRFMNTQEEVREISKSLKCIAVELGIPIVVLSQLNRNVENREGLDGKRPRLADIRESGSIEQDADLVLFLYRPEYYRIYNDENGRDLHGKAEVIVAKNRNGETKTSPGILMSFENKYTRFEDEETSSF